MKQFILKKMFTFHHILFMYYASASNNAYAMMKRHYEKGLHYAIKMGAIDPNEITLF